MASRRQLRTLAWWTNRQGHGLDSNFNQKAERQVRGDKQTQRVQIPCSYGLEGLKTISMMAFGRYVLNHKASRPSGKTNSATFHATAFELSIETETRTLTRAQQGPHTAATSLDSFSLFSPVRKQNDTTFDSNLVGLRQNSLSR